MVWYNSGEATKGILVMTRHTNIVVIGGGTGTHAMLESLKHYSDNLTAIVGMVDDGGSQGVLRNELGTRPPADAWKCMTALSDSPKLSALFKYRFEEGTFKGHSVGNLFLAGLEKMDGNFADALQTASEVLRVNGRVLPATLDDVRLMMRWNDEDKELHGEVIVDDAVFEHDPRKAELHIVPEAMANQEALDAIREADLVVIAPGDIYTSLGPLLVIQGFGEALAQTKALVTYVCNLVTKHGHTDGFSVLDHVQEIERFAGQRVVDMVFYNTQMPQSSQVMAYEAEDAHVVTYDSDELIRHGYKVVSGNYLGVPTQKETADVLPVTRGFIRHDTKKIGKELLQAYEAWGKGE